MACDMLSDSQKLDLYLPETGEGPFPLIVFIYGGGWPGGDKEDGQEIEAFLTICRTNDKMFKKFRTGW